MKVLENVKEVKQNTKKRNFKQTWDFSIGLKGLDLKKPENRLNLELVLPAGRGKDVKVVVFADALVKEARECADLVVTRQELEALIKDKKKMKAIANDYTWFLGEAPLMPVIGKNMGAILGPRGKVPKPIPPKANVKTFVELAKRTVRILLKDNPVVHIPVGTEDMAEEDVAKNIEAAFNLIKDRLPKGLTNIRSAHIKLTMSKPVRLEI